MIMNKDQIPVELAEQRRWVKRVGDKHGAVGWNKSENWQTLDEINPYDDAIFIMTDTDFLVIDQDDTVNESGELIPPAAEIMREIETRGGKTYEEESKSRRGRHSVYDVSEYPDAPINQKQIYFHDYAFVDSEGKKHTPKIEFWYAAKHGFFLTGYKVPGAPDTVTGGENAAEALRFIKQLPDEKPKKKSTRAAEKTTGETVPHGRRHKYLVERIGYYVSHIGATSDDEMILALLIADFYKNCENDDGIDDAHLREHYLKVITDTREKFEQNKKEPGFYKYAVKAWCAEHDGAEFDSNVTPWAEVEEAGNRAKENGVVFAQEPQTPAAIEYTDSTELSEVQALELSRKEADALNLIRTKEGRVLSIPENYYSILRDDPYLHGKLRYNQLDGRVYVHGVYWDVDSHPVRDVDLFNIRRFISAVYQIRNKEDIFDNIQAVADFNGYHPVRELLNSLEWDGVERIPDLLPRYLGAERSDYTTAVTRLLLNAVIQRVFHPGIKFDCAFVLADSQQGSGKSTLCRLLALDDGWFTDSLDDLNDNKRAFEALRGHVVVELGEMIATRRARDIETIKSYLSRTADDYRTPHAKFTERYPRQAVFIGTSNRSQFLPDDRTGNRRFIPILCDGKRQEVHPMKDIDEAREYVRQCYAEAMTLGARDGFSLVLSEEHMERLKRLQEISAPEDAKAGLIQEWLDVTKPKFVCSRMIYDYALPSIARCNQMMGNTPERWELQEISELMNQSIDSYVRYTDSDKKRFSDYGPQRAWMRVESVPRDVPRGVPRGSKSVPSDNNLDDFTEVQEDEGLPFD